MVKLRGKIKLFSLKVNVESPRSAKTNTVVLQEENADIRQNFKQENMSEPTHNKRLVIKMFLHGCMV